MAVKKEQLDKFWVVGVPLNVFCDDPQLNLRVYNVLMTLLWCVFFAV